MILIIPQKQLQQKAKSNKKSKQFCYQKAFTSVFNKIQSLIAPPI